jgi:hypothetical protein
MNGYSILLYRVRNLGDMIQTVAMSRHLPRTAGVFRHRLDAAEEDRLLIFNGLLDKCRPPKKQGAPCLFAGVSGPHFRRKQYLRWMANSTYPIGARDPVTLARMHSAGLRAVLIGCATLTLPRYDGPRSGIYSVDYPGPGERISHLISRRDSVTTQWHAALAALAKYRTAKAVYTSRLHVALPCLAFGTPVWIANPKREAWRACRFGIIEELGLPYEAMVTADVSQWARKYIEFLETHLSLHINSGEPKMPAVPAVSHNWLPRWLQW